MNDHVCVLCVNDYVLTNDGTWQNVLFTNAATVRQLLEVLLKVIKIIKV
jgi:thiamine phosphate synthase YjbQ (UPF0047 family)